ncbi:MAG: iron-sulfur cluster assembly scaffold protein [Desulfobacteraceae bacterium]|nr:iron-sulfur cluster assembly scaffold protein [Desulfobacteraceae bacterium]MBC2754992.1 iron-sulfur cluster assembly scaffold protein [Desulfobacteraceae bacterium]
MGKENRLHEKNHDHDHTLLSERFIRHANLPIHMGKLPGANGYAKGVGTCGDAIEVYLSIHDQKIKAR